MRFISQGMRVLNGQLYLPLMALFCLSVSYASEAEQPIGAVTADNQIPAFILKVEGTGTATVRKRIGTLESAGARGKIFEGDKVFTDGKSAVHLSLNDGTLIRIGLNSELRMERAQPGPKFVYWRFRLLRGSVRVLEEKWPLQEGRLRLETPISGLDPRGAELVLVHDASSVSSSLYMMEGVASFGAAGCEKSVTCVEVKGGQAAFVSEKQKGISPARSYEPRDLFRINGASSGGTGPAISESILSLFVDVKRASEGTLRSLDEGALKALLLRAKEEFSSAQDRAVGRDKEQRDEMQREARGGGFMDTLAAADAYAEAKQVFVAESNGGAENFVAQAVTAKFRLGMAVKRADKNGVFVDSPEPGSKGSIVWTGRIFRIRKNFDYQRAREAKASLDALNQELQDYSATLAYLEAMEADPNFGPQKIKTGIANQQAPPSCGLTCRTKNIMHELEVAAEGSANAYQQKKVSSPPQGKVVGSVGVGSISTPYFSRAIPGNGCFRLEKSCKKVPCIVKTKGSPCERGFSRELCVNKQIPVKCPADGSRQ